jgi:hypothetical protein
VLAVHRKNRSSGRIEIDDHTVAGVEELVDDESGLRVEPAPVELLTVLAHAHGKSDTFAIRVRQHLRASRVTTQGRFAQHRAGGTVEHDPTVIAVRGGDRRPHPTGRIYPARPALAPVPAPRRMREPPTRRPGFVQAHHSRPLRDHQPARRRVIGKIAVGIAHRYDLHRVQLAVEHRDLSR